jgi:hypothetical protein
MRGVCLHLYRTVCGYVDHVVVFILLYLLRTVSSVTGTSLYIFAPRFNSHSLTSSPPLMCRDRDKSEDWSLSDFKMMHQTTNIKRNAVLERFVPADWTKPCMRDSDHMRQVLNAFRQFALHTHTHTNIITLTHSLLFPAAVDPRQVRLWPLSYPP